jgi:hypothetical protein
MHGKFKGLTGIKDIRLGFRAVIYMREIAIVHVANPVQPLGRSVHFCPGPQQADWDR